jgi:hypothetical protein
MADLTNPKVVAAHLLAARLELDAAHHFAGETEGDATDLTGTTRDLLFGLNTMVDAVIVMVEAAANVVAERERLHRITGVAMPDDLATEVLSYTHGEPVEWIVEQTPGIPGKWRVRGEFADPATPGPVIVSFGAGERNGIESLAAALRVGTAPDRSSHNG